MQSTLVAESWKADRKLEYDVPSKEFNNESLIYWLPKKPYSNKRNYLRHFARLDILSQSRMQSTLRVNIYSSILRRLHIFL